MRRALVAVVALLVAAPVVRAHFPMLLASTPFASPGDDVHVRLTYGHPYMNDRYACEHPLRVQVYPPVGRAEDVTARIDTASLTYQGSELPAFDLTYKVRRPGDYVFAYQLPMFHEPPQRQVIDFAKVIVHVSDAQMGWWRRVGTPLELVPLTRPYALRVGQSLRVQVLEDGQPMRGACLEGETYTDVVPDPAPELAFYRREERADAQGVAAMSLDRAGWWVLTCATDGGPGEQGTLDRPVNRAVLWVYVGGP